MKHAARLLGAVSARLRRHGRGWVASLLQLAAVALLVAFADTFGTRWALLAGVAALVVLSLAVDGDHP